MKEKEKDHVTELLFTIALFCVFLISAIFVIVIGANVYRNAQKASDANYGRRTSLSYITEKIRQSDENGGISIGEMDDGTPALLITANYQGTAYTTYIYSSEGEMRELFVRNDTSADPQDGTGLIQDITLSFEDLGNSLLKITVTDKEGASSSVLAHPSSAGEGGNS
ncbi:DUF4860 domain-containing protein [Roseburia hominis]